MKARNRHAADLVFVWGVLEREELDDERAG
jgi:hypothetical protein